VKPAISKIPLPANASTNKIPKNPNCAIAHTEESGLPSVHKVLTSANIKARPCTKDRSATDEIEEGDAPLLLDCSKSQLILQIQILPVGLPAALVAV
jgi:hypothetical protein